MASIEIEQRRLAPGWRTPLLIIVCGCAIALLSFGPRSALGFFVQPMSREFAWGRDVFSLALAVQNLLWGLGQPIAGAIADRFGVMRVMCVGAVLYAAGLFLMSHGTQQNRNKCACFCACCDRCSSPFPPRLPALRKREKPNKIAAFRGAG